ncbi:membrane protein insertase YidC [Prevotella sp. E9-3]|uniref:membrane protein insertase YidC n=1 Tax=Prevotella sp. E9-3 TaxID=2913621 RepID=UPI001EDBACCA|nr:membrane protein insertase YidC [Prevotella sp. E9-3]UKK49530.1 membrane protein insertase YidC [Prevotella sp. E9-3]
MDKNTLTGMVLMAAVFIGYIWWSQPTQEEIDAYHKQQDSIAAVQRDAQVKAEMAEQERKDAAEASILADSTALFYQALSGESNNITLKNDKLELTFSTKGGTLTKAVILGFEDKDSANDVTLFTAEDQQMNFMLAGKNENIITKDLYFTPTNITDRSVTMTAPAQNGGSISFNYELGDDYMLHFSFTTEGLAGLFAPNYGQVDVEWISRARQQEKGFMFENRYATLTYKKKDGSTDYLSETSEDSETIEEPLDWVAFKNQFFSAVLISKDDFASNATLHSTPQEKGSGYLKNYEAKLCTTFDPKGVHASEFEMYIGPNDFRLIKDVEEQSRFNKDLDLEQLVYLGWPLFRIINRWFTIYVFDWLTSFGFNMGIVLILITLLLKAITFPMVKKSYMSSAKMRVLKPKLDEATKQYDKPEDQMQKQQAMMQLYAQYGVSPLSGCLPMLIQMPIWIAMFNFVPNAIQLRRESFLWIDDLSTYDPIIEWSFNIWGIGDHLSLTCILFCVANILYSYMTMRQQRDQMVGQQAEQMKMMQWMMYLMPLMFFFMFNDYSAGLNFYYFVSLFFSAAIMWTLRKTTDDAKLLAILEAKYKENKNNPKKMSGLAARLEAMQKQAEELQRQRQNGYKK